MLSPSCVSSKPPRGIAGNNSAFVRHRGIAAKAVLEEKKSSLKANFRLILLSHNSINAGNQWHEYQDFGHDRVHRRHALTHGLNNVFGVNRASKATD